MARIEVVRKTGLTEGQSSPGILREKAFEGEGVLFSRSTSAAAWCPPGTTTGEGTFTGSSSPDT